MEMEITNLNLDQENEAKEFLKLPASVIMAILAEKAETNGEGNCCLEFQIAMKNGIKVETKIEAKKEEST